MSWNREYSMQAMREGWDVFDADGTLAIQKLDDPSSVEELGYNDPRFEDDVDAINHVLVKAREGSPLHLRALADVHGVPFADAVEWIAKGERDEMGGKR